MSGMVGWLTFSLGVLALVLSGVTSAQNGDAWRKGWNAAKYAIAEENSYARNAAIRVDKRLNECLGSGRKWSAEHKACND